MKNVFEIVVLILSISSLILNISKTFFYKKELSHKKKMKYEDFIYKQKLSKHRSFLRFWEEEKEMECDEFWNNFAFYLHDLFISEDINNKMRISLYRIEDGIRVEKIKGETPNQLTNHIEIANNTELNIALQSKEIYFNNDIEYYMKKGYEYESSYLDVNIWNSVWCMPIKKENAEIVGFLSVVFSKSLREDIDFSKIEKLILKKNSGLLEILEKNKTEDVC